MGIAREVINMVRSKYIDGKKVCSICKEAYPMTEEYFCRSNRIKDGFRGQCKKCKHKVDYEDVKSHVLEKNKIRYNKNKETIISKQKVYRELKKKHYQEYNKEYYIKNKELLKSASSAYYYENKNNAKMKATRKEYAKNWRRTKDGKLKLQKYRQTRRSIKRQLPCSLTIEEWCESLEYFDNACAYCCEKNDELHQEHIIPLSKGGGYIKQNIIPACPNCNYSKNAQKMEDWYPVQNFYTKMQLDKIKSWMGVDLEYNTQQISIL